MAKKLFFKRHWRGDGKKFVVGEECPEALAKHLKKVGEFDFVLTEVNPVEPKKTEGDDETKDIEGDKSDKNIKVDEVTKK